jgi:hypothetical protein
VLNKLDMVPEEERAARVKDFVKRYKWKGPVFQISALTGEGCRELIYAIKDHLAALKAEEAAAWPSPTSAWTTACKRRRRRRQRSLKPAAAATITTAPETGKRHAIGHRPGKTHRRQVGSSLVTNDGKGLDHDAIALGGADRQAARRGQGSGAGQLGRDRRGHAAPGLGARPKEIHELQAAAAVGQMGLAQVYESQFALRHSHRAGAADPRRPGRPRALPERALHAADAAALGVVPIINENDTVVTDEIKFGDNDTLGALVANLIEGDA